MRKPRSKRNRIQRTVSVIVLLLLGIGVLWAATALQTALVPSRSMEPTLMPGDLLLVRKDAYREGRLPRRGDIVVFERKGERDYFVKRVIGLPGETISIYPQGVAIDRQWLREPYVAPEIVMEYPMQCRVREGEYFLMGDNRAHSEDSRDTGPVKLEAIRGKVTAVILPLLRRCKITNPFVD